MIPEKQIRKQKKIIIILSSVLAVCIAFLTFLLISAEGNPFSGGSPTPVKDAPGMVEKYRDRFSFKIKSNGVYYDTAGLREYLDNFPKKISATAGAKTDPNYKWVVGFYWMRKLDTTDGIVKHDFCLVPTLVNINKPKDVKDYFDPKNNSFYNHKYDNKPLLKQPPGDPANPEDEGNMFP